MSRSIALFALVGFTGMVLVLGEIQRVARPTLADRVRPYLRGRGSTTSNRRAVGLHSFREVLTPLAQSFGERIGRLAGVTEDLSRRLARIHAPYDATAFRLRQLAHATVATMVALALCAAVRPPLAVVALFVIGAPVLAFLLLEQQLATATSRRRAQLLDELPVVAEQLGLLLGAGYSLGAALGVLARRSDGACAADLRRVSSRVRQGLSDIDALVEWAELIDLDAAHRLIGVLSLNRRGGDLSRIVAEEARSMRLESHRRLVERIERRNQQVWIPVTVATLLPGVLFMAVPFVQALTLFSAS
jgi:tight adherence protein C